MGKIVVNIKNIIINLNGGRKGGEYMENKLQELVLYISGKSKNDPSFGATKLNKILFGSDFYYYGTTGKSISGTQYVHRSKGPTPKYMKRVLDEMVENGKIEIRNTMYFGYPQKKVAPLQEPNLSIFGTEEIEFLDQIIDHFRPYNGKELSDWTHKLTPWLLTDEEEDIPYQSVFVLNRLPVERSGLRWARTELERLRREEGYAH